MTPNPTPDKLGRKPPRRFSHTSTSTKSKATAQRGYGERTLEQHSNRGSSPEVSVPKGGSDEIYIWIRQEVEASRGTELQGTLNPDVLAILFHKQASKWRYLANAHFQAVLSFTCDMLSQILNGIECDRVTRKKIWPQILEAGQALDKEKSALLNEHMDDLTTKHLQTHNSAFLENVAKARLLRFQAALFRYQQTCQDAAGNKDRLVIDLQDTSALFSELHISNSRNLENEIHDTLKAYYDIARDEFVEFVTQLVVEKFLDSPHGPVLRFSPLYVAGLSDVDIADLAREDEAVILERQEQQATLDRLRQAEKIALRYL